MIILGLFTIYILNNLYIYFFINLSQLLLMFLYHPLRSIILSRLCQCWNYGFAKFLTKIFIFSVLVIEEQRQWWIIAYNLITEKMQLNNLLGFHYFDQLHVYGLWSYIFLFTMFSLMTFLIFCRIKEEKVKKNSEGVRNFITGE